MHYIYVLPKADEQPANCHTEPNRVTSGYATRFTAGGAIRIVHYDVIDDVITQKL